VSSWRYAKRSAAYLRGTTSLEKLSHHERQIERSLIKATRELDLLHMHPFYARNIRAFPAPGNVERKEKGRFNPRSPLNEY